MRLALYQPDIPQNTGTILRLAACLSVPIDLIGPARFDSSDRSFRKTGLDYLDHVNLCGENHGARLNDVGVIWKSSGENLGFYPSSDSDPVTPIVNAWMESQSHRKNILTREYTHSGIGIALNDAGGVYITQNFVNY